jgi:ADP-dependent NAD(P)H-hydrate dehydratase / NAD(P)H-hydrate epimerase
VIPIVTPEEMAGVDRQAPEPVDVLIDRAGAAVARAALELLGGAYGQRVVIVAGRGNNGNDGRAAAVRLRARGVRVSVLQAGDLGPGAALPRSDLVVDAAYGNGLARPYAPPDPGDAPVLAVDIPSGISGLTGRVVGGDDESDTPAPLRADATITFAALKPGLFLADGPSYTGRVELAGIGLDRLAAGAARAHLVTDEDVAAAVPARPRSGHKWQTAVALVAGSPGMTGAPWMASRAALRSGAGYVRLGLPGVDPGAAGFPPGEIVLSPLSLDDWAADALQWVSRCKALVVGPGLGPAERGSGAASLVGRLLVGADCPAVVDADGLNTLGSLDAVAEVARQRRAPTVLTPHEGEWARLVGGPPGEDRLESVRQAAARAGAVILLKGSATVVADPEGRVLVATAGSPRLATAGTGDVLSGVIGAFLARGVPALEAAALGAHVHGRAAGIGRPEGLIATDLPDLVSDWLGAALHDGAGDDE